MSIFKKIFLTGIFGLFLFLVPNFAALRATTLGACDPNTTLWCQAPDGKCANAPVPSPIPDNYSTLSTCRTMGQAFGIAYDALGCTPTAAQPDECVKPQIVTTQGIGCCIIKAPGTDPRCVDLTSVGADACQAGSAYLDTVAGLAGILGSLIKDNTTVLEFHPPAECTQISFCTAYQGKGAVTGSTGGLKGVETNFTPIKPLLQINIPTVNFSDIQVQGETGKRYVDIPYLAEYVKGVFNYALGLLAMIAVIMIMIGGVKYIMARGGGGVGEAKKMIGNAVFGLILGLLSFVILNAVSPSLTNLSTLRTTVLERIVYEDGDNEKNMPAATADSASPSGSGSSIAAIIGGYQGSPCSAQGAQDAAKKLDAAQICVGPCHCAWTASAFLNYIGCNNPSDAHATRLPVKADQAGWITVSITSANRDNLPVGILMKGGGKHNGVSLGNGFYFESGGNMGSSRFFSKVSTCPRDNTESQKNSEGCKVCGKLTGHEPWTNKYAGGAGPGGGCSNNQGWVMAKMSQGGWDTVTAPAESFPGGAPQIQKTSCSYHVGGGTYQATLSPDLCSQKGL